MVELFSTTAVAMAGLSMGFVVGSSLAKSKAAPSTVKPPTAKPIQLRPALQEHARAIGIARSKTWIHCATRAELQEAIRAHNEQRRAA